MTQPQNDKTSEETSDTVREILGELKEQGSKLREIAVAMEQNVVRLNAALGAIGREHAPWIKTFLDEAIMVDLGANLDLSNVMVLRANGMNKTVQSLISVALGAFVNGGVSGNDTGRMADALATGMTESAAGCTCGICAACKLIDARGVEVAVPELHRRMRDTITVPRDKILDRRIITNTN